jgi:hypothetical protein
MLVLITFCEKYRIQTNSTFKVMYITRNMQFTYTNLNLDKKLSFVYSLKGNSKKELCNNFWDIFVQFFVCLIEEQKKYKNALR